MSVVIPADLPRFTGSPADLRHCATAFGVAAWRLRQVADDLGARDPLRDRAAPDAGAALHEASSEVRGALVAFADTAQALLVRLRYQQTLLARLDSAPPEAPPPDGGGARELTRRSCGAAVEEEIRRIVEEFRRAELAAVARIDAVCRSGPARPPAGPSPRQPEGRLSRGREPDRRPAGVRTADR